ncbi:DUF4377 domain-containing protein [Pontibacter akesuensis]|uniref:DUF4377 domain-containing protein n=1 Tax=Pontibacter akesuensis TaxID=388950 RepID=A0A1I7G0A5_9BACT|nr:DUF4377 domain-containing protein [Pontibacter akesuensis]GHA59633.1 hypothetical protein GCM10007389_09590 [Pontibacter akesuensis]SFU41751.1 protein of unknown function [Pontibacter akesuensis]
MKNITLVAALILGFSSCKKEALETVETTMHVNYYRQSCQGVGEMKCLLVQEGNQVGSSDWTLFYDRIEGFQYEEGFTYVLRVRVEKVENPPADGSSRKYILLKIISKDEV